MSGLIVLDIDHIDNLPEVYQQLKNDNLTYMLFISPSADGLKLIVKHNLKDELKWNFLYQELEDSYLNRFGIVLDKSGKDISRMCYLPFIENLYRNDNSFFYEYKGNFEYKKVAKSGSTTLADNLTSIEKNNTYNEFFYISDYLNKHNIDITDSYQDWISYGYSLCSLGEAGRQIFHKISSVSDKYEFNECEDKYDYMLAHYDNTKNSIENFNNNAKMAIAEYILYKEYGYK